MCDEFEENQMMTLTLEAASHDDDKTMCDLWF